MSLRQKRGSERYENGWFKKKNPSWVRSRWWRLTLSFLNPDHVHVALFCSLPRCLDENWLTTHHTNLNHEKRLFAAIVLCQRSVTQSAMDDQPRDIELDRKGNKQMVERASVHSPLHMCHSEYEIRIFNCTLLPFSLFRLRICLRFWTRVLSLHLILSLDLLLLPSPPPPHSHPSHLPLANTLFISPPFTKHYSFLHHLTTSILSVILPI